MIIIILTIKYGSTYYKAFTMGVRSNYHGYFFQCIFLFIRTLYLFKWAMYVYIYG